MLTDIFTRPPHHKKASYDPVFERDIGLYSVKLCYNPYTKVENKASLPLNIKRP